MREPIQALPFIPPTQGTFNYLERLQTSVSQTPLSSLNLANSRLRFQPLQKSAAEAAAIPARQPLQQIINHSAALQLCQRDNRFKI